MTTHGFGNFVRPPKLEPAPKESADASPKGAKA
jgi:hypothetical protein